MNRISKIAAGLAAAGLVVAAPAHSETQTETIVAEQRTSVSLRVAPEAAQAMLPAGWISNAQAGGPNLTVIFMDRKLALGPDGKPLQAGVNWVMVLAMSARNRASGEVRSMIVGGYSADPLGVPGAYKVYRPGAVTLTRTEQSGAKDGKLETTVEEHWTAKGADGASVDLSLSYSRGVPAFSTFEQKNYSAADPEFYRIYRGEQASEAVRNASTDHVRSVKLTAAGGALGRAMDGSQQIVGITVAPFYARRTFLP